MQNHCDKCQITIEPDRSHCPLCGRCTNEENLDKPRRYEKFPNYALYSFRRASWVRILTVLLIAANAIGFLTNFLIEGNVFLAGYFLAGSIVVFFTVLLPIAHRFSFEKQFCFCAVFIAGIIIFLELYSHTYGWGVNFVLPFWFLGIAIASASTMMSRGYYKTSSFYPLLLIAVLSSVLFSLKLTVLYEKQTLWPSLASFSASWGIFVVISVFYRKRILRTLHQDFHITKKELREMQ